MSRLVPVHAYALAATLQPKDWAALVPGAKVKKSHLTGAYGGGHVVIHDFGALVFFGVDPGECKKLLDKVLAKLPPEPKPPLEETFKVEVRADASPEAVFDRVVVRELTPAVIELVSLVIAQSEAMEYYEDEVDKVFSEIEKLTTSLAERGSFRGGEKPLMQFIGRAMSTRNDVVFTLALLDAPPATWEDERLDKLHRDLRASFEIEDRYMALDHKLKMIQDSLELLVDLSRHKRMTMLEVLVVLLIAFEIVLSLIRAH
jgi:uncharacterized Rmd1/YagE family protein